MFGRVLYLTDMIQLQNKIKIPQRGFGTFLLEGESAYQSVLTALKEGYRLIDTAAVYQNEEPVGRAIRDSGLARNEIVISTKLIATKKTYEEVLEEFQKSMDRLQVEYIDIYWLHWMPRKYEELKEIWEAFEYLYRQGKCRAIGICNISLYYLNRLLQEAEIPPMLCQAEHHPFLQQEILVEYCRKNKIVFVGYGLLAKGHVFENQKLQQLAMEYHTTIANLLISWGLNKDIIVLVKSQNARRIKENFHNNFKITEELADEINQLNEGLRFYRDPENNPYVK